MACMKSIFSSAQQNILESKIYPPQKVHKCLCSVVNSAFHLLSSLSVQYGQLQGNAWLMMCLLWRASPYQLATCHEGTVLEPDCRLSLTCCGFSSPHCSLSSMILFFPLLLAFLPSLESSVTLAVHISHPERLSPHDSSASKPHFHRSFGES